MKDPIDNFDSSLLQARERAAEYIGEELVLGLEARELRVVPVGVVSEARSLLSVRTLYETLHKVLMGG